jgi:signal transduction histidine kinase
MAKRVREHRLRQLAWMARMGHLESRTDVRDWGADRWRWDERRDWRWHLRARHRWHQRWHRHHANFKHSLGARLIAIFVVMALLSSLVVWGTIGQDLGPLTAVVLLLLLTATAYGAIRHIVRPISALAAGAEAFGRGDLHHRVPVIHRDEIGDLAVRFNQMADDIQAMLDGKRALLLAISHELRSPLTRARLHAELVEEGASKGALLEELGQMRDMISALLESERLDRGHTALQLAPCDLAALVQEQAQPGVGLQIEPGLSPLPVDRMRIQLLLRNLVHNALRHNDPAQGPVVVALEAVREGGGSARAGGASSPLKAQRLRVRDHGPGVPPEALPQLGQPFFRPDEARTRSEGGVGLGLSLCRLVAQAHGSQLMLRNASPGFEVWVDLPITRPEATHLT